MPSPKKLLLIIFLAISTISFSQNGPVAYLLKHGNISLPVNNRGVLADVTIEGVHGMQFKSNYVIYSAGFLLSGKNGNDLWVNGISSVSRIEDYLPGTYKNPKLDSLAYLYVVKKSDKHFGKSWQQWKNAVKLGADFYDGDNDGIYNPIDKNGNNKWDMNEDRPDLIGDETIWCVYKDSKPKDQRLFWNIAPQGIEIQQTVFVSNASEELNNTVFVRYKIDNTGIVSEKFDSVYFSLRIDPDLGYYGDDLIGCDTLLNAGYCYQNEPDTTFGENTPAVLFDIISGPIAYIPGVTFEDINNNNTFDSGDVPLDSVLIVKGKTLGVKKILGAKLLGMSSFIQNVQLYPTDPPVDEFSLRFNALGKLRNGKPVNPCDWTLGEILNLDCTEINGSFMYSGDPIFLNGWINNYPSDQSVFLNTGPFELKINNPIEIVVAYIVGDGSSPLESLKFAKINSRKVQFLFNNNIFETKQDSFFTQPSKEIIYDFVLYQNFPNPFGKNHIAYNPSTTIRYNLHRKGYTTLKIYDVLGQELTTLVSEIQNEGIHIVKFNGTHFPAGIYYYTLTQGAFSETKKMVILK